MIYLDNNATTPLDRRVLEAMLPYMTTPIGNASSIHRLGQRAKEELIQAAADISRFMPCPGFEIIFTSGATEALNMLIFGITSKKQKGHIVTSVLEHRASLAPIRKLEQKGFTVSYLKPEPGKGSISADQLAASLKSDTCLIVLMAVNNETGVVTDMKNVSFIAEQQGIPLVVDGVAWIGKAPLTLQPGVSAFCFSSHKIHGPPGIGVACVRKHLKCEPLIMGGPQQNGRRGGTENLPAAIGCAKAVQLIAAELSPSIHHMEALRAAFEREIKKIFPQAMIHGETELRVCNTSSITFPNLDGEAFLMRLDLAHIAASHGSACSSGALEPSHVLLGMGISSSLARSSLRFSMSKFTTQEEIYRAIEGIEQEIKFLS